MASMPHSCMALAWPLWLSVFIIPRHEYWRRQWHPTPVLLPRKSHGGRSLVGCSPWGCQESDMTERLHFHFSLSCIGEGNGNPLQCSCLENPRDGGAWWAAVYGVAQSRTRLKQLSSSSSCLSLSTLDAKFSSKFIYSNPASWGRITRGLLITKSNNPHSLYTELTLATTNLQVETFISFSSVQ